MWALVVPDHLGLVAGAIRIFPLWLVLSPLEEGAPRHGVLPLGASPEMA